MDRDLPYPMPDEELVASELAAEASARARGGGSRSKSTGGAFSAVEAFGHHQHDESARQRAAGVAELWQLVRQDRKARR
jgi:hypothetical protein